LAVGKKEELAKALNELLGVKVNWMRLPLKDLEKIHGVLSSPTKLLDVLARATRGRIRGMKVGEVLDLVAKGMGKRERPILDRILGLTTRPKKRT